MYRVWATAEVKDRKEKRGIKQGRIQRATGAISAPKTNESSFVDHDFVQFGKQNSRYKAILPSIVLSQPSCKVNVIFTIVMNLQLNLTISNITEIDPLNVLAVDPPLASKQYYRKWQANKTKLIGIDGKMAGRFHIVL